MVNMNAADDKESINKSTKVNGVNGDSMAGSSGTCGTSESGENITTQLKVNVISHQNSDCSKHPMINGVYPKTTSVTSNASIGIGNGDPVSSRKNSPTQTSDGKSENAQYSGESENHVNAVLKSNPECYPENNNASVNFQRQPRNRAEERNVCDYARSSSSEGSDDDEECCIYTYKGDSSHMADLPSSFFRLDLMPSRPNVNSRNSSPDMDYLEMDFDPGPSNGRYSSSDSECDDEREDEDRFSAEASLLNFQEHSEPPAEGALMVDINLPSPISPISTPSPLNCPRPQSSSEQSYPSASTITPPSSPPRQPQAPLEQQSADVEAMQPNYCYCITNKLSAFSIDENFNEGNTGTMVWKEQEAREKQVTQIAISACGATAVINALLGLSVPFTVSAVKEFVDTRLRSDSSPVVDYLLSRCNAGATHEDMIRGLQGASQDAVYARFFHMYPQRSISLTNWLSHWLRKGAVPIVTLNLQRGRRSNAEIPDMWHHQMVYGVGSRGIYLTNPLEVQSESALWPQLASPSILLIRRDDVISRWTPESSLRPLIHPSRPRWRKMNVLGQVANMIREDIQQISLSTTHIAIPASYSAGVTLAVLRSSPAYDELRHAPELPVDPFAPAPIYV